MDVTSLQKRPKQPFTPLYAFVAAKQLKLKKDNPYLSTSERLVRRGAILAILAVLRRVILLSDIHPLARQLRRQTLLLSGRT